MNGRPDPKWIIVGPRGVVRSPEHAAQLLLHEVERLRPTARRSWNLATKRTFDVGIQAGADRRPFELQIEPATLARIATLRGRPLNSVLCGRGAGALE
jgi:hypothetical protein